MNTSLTILFSSFVGVFAVLMVIGALWLEKIRQLAISTHAIVNNERSVMLRTIANMAARIARDNPEDVAAQKTAIDTQDDADKARK